ncbi:MAG TPA: hypothetical protein VH393_17395 [Ktedonobacterales bacterium]|jgi:hypothetical protein
MSVVTNAILHYHLDYEEFLSRVNTFFPPNIRGFVSVGDKQLPEAWYGGSKYLECGLAIGAFNHLDLQALIEHICQIDYPQTDTQLIIKEQEEERFKIINISDEIARRRQGNNTSES